VLAIRTDAPPFASPVTALRRDRWTGWTAWTGVGPFGPRSPSTDLSTSLAWASGACQPIMRSNRAERATELFDWPNFQHRAAAAHDENGLYAVGSRFDTGDTAIGHHCDLSLLTGEAVITCDWQSVVPVVRQIVGWTLMRLDDRSGGASRLLPASRRCDHSLGCELMPKHGAIRRGDARRQTLRSHRVRKRRVVLQAQGA
jgi:hypothetical protein